MIGCADEDGVEIFFFEQVAIVAVGARLFLRFLALTGDLNGTGEHLLIDVADGNDLHRGNLDQSPQVALAVPTGANEADAFWFPVDDVKGVRAECGEGDRSGSGLEETTAINVKGSCGLPRFAIRFHVRRVCGRERKCNSAKYAEILDHGL